MKILKYKKSTKNRYKVYLDNNQELLLYEEVILEYNLLIKKEISDELLIDINKSNLKWDVYYAALDIIKKHIRSINELRNILESKEYPNNLIEESINLLISQGYLNDNNYAKSYINHTILTTLRGPLRIENELLDKGVDIDIIRNALTIFTEEDQKIRIHNIIRHNIKSNHNRGGVVLKQKIYSNLINQGYESYLIDNIIDEYTFEVDKEIAKKEYDKLYRKLSRKYDGEELKERIMEKLSIKGLKYEE